MKGGEKEVVNFIYTYCTCVERSQGKRRDEERVCV